MSVKKLNIAIVFGGRSPEHDISLLSAQNIIAALDKERFNAIMIGIDRAGKWYVSKSSNSLIEGSDVGKLSIATDQQKVILSQNSDQGQLLYWEQKNEGLQKIDVIFPVLHGNYGEDGSIQGLAKLADIPCVGCGIPGSAVGMDKDLMKRILRDTGILVAPGRTIRYTDENKPSYLTLSEELGPELFVKPANLGSSVGVSFVKNEPEYEKALALAFQYDAKVMIEKRLIGRELECAVLGNMHPKTSGIGEIIPKGGFYSFDNKYIDEQGAELSIPAQIPDSTVSEIQEIARKTFKVLECRGLARIDVFLTDDGIFVNEINTMPGFTNISMYPKLWELSGLSNQSLVTNLIELAIEDHATVSSLKSNS